ncbi:MAG TPA: hypothetical protein VHT04_12135 [Stellaceae bacterium]|nr:hypothetical protein [Stellaceae bacterium]
MCEFKNDFDRAKQGYSPDRTDALVFALSELLLGESEEAWLEFIERDWAMMRGEIERPKIAPAPESQTIAQSPSRPHVTLRAPGPHMHYAPSRGKRYSSDANGVIENVDADDLKPLLAAGSLLFWPAANTARVARAHLHSRRSAAILRPLWLMRSRLDCPICVERPEFAVNRQNKAIIVKTKAGLSDSNLHACLRSSFR